MSDALAWTYLGTFGMGVAVGAWAMGVRMHVILSRVISGLPQRATESHHIVR